MEVHFINDETGSAIVGYSNYKSQLPRVGEYVYHGDGGYLVVKVIHKLGIVIEVHIVCRKVYP